MKAQDWIYMDGYDEVRTAETFELVFETKELTCNEPNNFSSVVDNVVSYHNSGKTLREIDDYLLDEELCTQEDREHIVETAYVNYYDKLTLDKL